LLREGLWLRLLLAVAVLSVAFVFLGRWQYHRHTAKVARNVVIDTHYTAPPTPLGTVLTTPSTPLTAAQQWTPVEVSGVYEPGGTVLVRNRPLDGEVGYEIVVPLRTPSGAALLVDRGWVPAADDALRPESVPEPPGGRVTVVARLRLGEGRATTGSPPGQESRMDLAQLATHAGGTVYTGAYGVLASEQPVTAPMPTLLPRPDEGLGPHLAYAFQWWFGAVAAWVLLGYYAVREAGQRAVTPADRTGQGPSGPTPRRRRRGPTDEEWEDAALG
jgi:cytochrome oxidase assembly protein ShyY1